MQKPIKIRKYTKFERKDFLFIYLMVAFPILQAAVFWLYVNLSMIGMAFQDSLGAFSLQSFNDVFAAFKGADRWGFNLWNMTLRSVFTFVIQQVQFVVSIPLAYILTKKMIGSKVFRALYAVPGICGAVVWTTIMKNIYAFDGPLVMISQKLGIDLAPIIRREGFLGEAPYAYITLIVTNFVLGLTGGNLIFASTFMRIPNEIFEAADIDGIGFWREIFSIAIPCSWSTISTFLIFNLCGVFTSDVNAYLYSNGTGEPGLQTISFYLYFVQVSLTQGKNYYSYISAFGIVITLATLPIVLLGSYIINKRESVEI